MALFVKDVLSKTKKLDFGSYLNLIEDNIFECESFEAKFQRKIHQKKLKIFQKRFIFLIKVLTLIIFPIILIALSLINSSLIKTGFFEYSLFLLWTVMGGVLTYKSYRESKKNIIEIQNEIKYLKITARAIYEYGKIIAICFFEKKNDIDFKFIHGFDQKTIEKIHKNLNEIEFDLNIFEIIASKSSDRNLIPIVADDGFTTHQREFSQNYLYKYFNIKINSLC